MQLYQWLSSVADDRGSAKALVYRDTYLSWRGLLHRVDRRAQELHAMGIVPGAWVGLMLGNVPDFAILALALSKLGATVVPLDPTTGKGTRVKFESRDGKKHRVAIKSGTDLGVTGKA